MTPRSELALTSVVVAALVASAVVVSIAALGRVPYGNADGKLMNSAAAVNADEAMAPNSSDKAEAEVLDRDLQPFCFNVGDNKLPSAPDKQLLGRDNRIFAHDSVAGATEGRAAEGSLVIPRPAADALPRLKVGVVARVSALGCGVGNYR